MKAIPPSAHVKILDYQAEVWGCFDIYKSATEEWELWAKNIFKVKKPSESIDSTKWYQFWKKPNVK